MPELEKNRVSARIKANLVKTLGVEKAETAIRKNIDTIANNLEKRERLDMNLDIDLDLKIHNIKKKTKYPKWYIIEKCLIYEMNKSSEGQMIDDIEGNEIKGFEGVEPENCPKCGAGSDELLISHADSTYYCYECGNRDEY